LSTVNKQISILTLVNSYFLPRELIDAYVDKVYKIEVENLFGIHFLQW